MKSFAYHRATSLANAAAVLKAHTEARVLAGGMTLLPTMKLGLAQPTDVVDLGSIAELRGIRHIGDRLAVGALSTHAEVAASTEVGRTIPALAALAAGIGDPQVRNRGTLGGSVANNDPSADYPAAVLALDAFVQTDRRSITADRFFQGMFTTALEPGELIKAIEFRIPKRAGYAKFPNGASRYAMVGVMVADLGHEIRVAVTGAGPGVFRVPAFEEALRKRFAPEAVDGLKVPADDLNSDLHASAAYRAHLVGIMAKRAIGAATR
ncbi:MAG: xanthine dehydrogenase family protein subunit M [Steroidobacteraceae bacterium]